MVKLFNFKLAALLLPEWTLFDGTMVIFRLFYLQKMISPHNFTKAMLKRVLRQYSIMSTLRFILFSVQNIVIFSPDIKDLAS